MELKILSDEKSYLTFHNNSNNVQSALQNKKISNPKNWPKEWSIIEEKTYPRLPKIKLPVVDNAIDMNLKDAIHYRNTQRTNNNKEALSIEEFSTLLRNSVNIRRTNDESSFSIGRRVYPSAGARFPLECYIIVNNISGLEKGLYHYELSDDSLAQLVLKNMEKDIKDIFGEKFTQSKAVIIITSVMNRNLMKYGERGYRFALIEAGHLMQNLCLLSTAINIPLVPIGGFVDVLLYRLLELNGSKEIPIYSCVLV